MTQSGKRDERALEPATRSSSAAPRVEFVGWLGESWPEHDWSRAEVRQSCFHDVAILAPHFVARASRHGDQVERVRRERSVLEAVAAVVLPVATPRCLSDVVARAGRAGMLTTYVPGQPRPDVPWAEAAGPIGGLLRALSEVDVAAVRDPLPVPRAWCGAERWPALVEERLSPRLPEDLRPIAMEVVGAVLGAERGAGLSLVHGDVGPHNFLWDGSRMVGIIDFDHACAGDPAIDAASLISAYGAAAVGTVVDAPTLERAMRHRATLTLQLAAAAELLGDDPLRSHALGNFVARVRAGTLYDPGGRHPRG